MTSNAERAETLRRALHAGVQGDRSVLRELYCDDVRAWAPAQAAESLDELLEELERRDHAFSDIALEVIPLDVNGDFACAEWRIAMTHVGELELRDGDVLAPTGLRVAIQGVTVAEFRDARICAVRQYWDELAVFEQLGLAGGPPS